MSDVQDLIGHITAIMRMNKVKALTDSQREIVIAAVGAWMTVRRPQGEPVVYMYEENGETYFGHPEGHHPPDAVPLYARSRLPVAVPKITDAMVWAACKAMEVHKSHECRQCPAEESTPYGKGTRGCRLVVQDGIRAALAASQHEEPT